MNMKQILMSLLLLLTTSLYATDVVTVSYEGGINKVELTKTTVLYDADDWEVAKKAACLLAADIERVTGNSIVAQTTALQNGEAVIVGTIGHSRWIDRLVEEGKLDISTIQGGWERFIVRTIEHPFEGVKRAIVVAGSDRRGTAYGVFSISEAIGVSPWYWWADVPVVHRDAVFVEANYVSDTPSIKYRGIFINDEDWGMKPWASKNFEKELNDIGPKTYAKVCELILRLKGNMLAPAMHTCTGAFYSHPDSKKVADEYGILITTSHCEPLLFNNASTWEWNKGRDGEWNYKTNRKTILKKLDNRVKEAAPYENVYTLAMRGLHDEGMRGDMSEEEKVEMLSQAITDQRKILKKYIDKTLEEVPQIFVPYKEALELYEAGLKVPDEVTLVWVDDNYGYLKRLSNPDEQKRTGRAGVYYHTSYLGAPHDYLWLNTTPPVLMYEELKKAYDTGADRYWLLNVGDIKPMELAVTTFFDMAWDFDRFDYQNVNRHQADYLAGVFGQTFRGEFQTLLDDYYRLAWSRKPEFMGWEREWDAPHLEKLSDTEYSFANYNDARGRLADYRLLSDKAKRLLDVMPKAYRPAFYEMVAYPAMASYQMNRKFLMAQLNHELLKQNDVAGANWAARESELAFDSIQALNDCYNSLLDGKWNYMMELAPGWCAKYQNMPDVTFTEGVVAQEVDINPLPNEDVLQGCAVLDLADYTSKTESAIHSLQLLEGLGYDWRCIQLGEATQPVVDPRAKDAPRFEYELGKIDADSVEVTVYTLPFFPIYEGRSTRFGVSVDQSEVAIGENLPKEYSPEWKTQVLQNGAVFKAVFPIDPMKEKHTLALICGDPGMIVQRVVVDWGGLKKTYVGPRSYGK